ncbi:MAG: NAD(P)/FAD-dependent oxidoreductase [Coriobacteriales bacterium]|jgi:NAD(P)H-nitrite reductase large subunit
MNQTQTIRETPVAIVGYGTAGVNAIIGLRTAGYEGEITVFSDTGTLPYSPMMTSYYAGGKKAYEECFPWTAEELESLGATVVAGNPVDEIDVAGHLIRCGGETFRYRKCILATGATPQTVGFPPVDGYEPIVLRTMDDAQRLKDAIEDPGCWRVLVSGASMVALKSLEACLDRGVDVTIVGMNPHVLDFNAFEEAAERFERGLEAKGVHMRFGQTMRSVALLVDDEEGRLGVTFSDGEMECFDEIVVCHGMRCNLGFLPEGALEMDRALLVDEFMRTSDPDVYAAGDIAQALELISGERRIVGIWKNAARQGEVAGAAVAAELAGEQPSPEKAYTGSIPTNTIAVNGTLFISGGTMEMTPERYKEVRETDDMTVVYLFENQPEGERRLVGFNLVCDHDEEGSDAYDTGAMLTLRIEEACR